MQQKSQQILLLKANCSTFHRKMTYVLLETVKRCKILCSLRCKMNQLAVSDMASSQFFFVFNRMQNRT